MNLPFTTNEFLEVFKSYNQNVFPLQILFYIIAFFSIYLVFSKQKNKSKIISLILSFFWIWIGAVYQIIFFSAINKAAYIFGLLFILQGILFLYHGVIKDNISFEYRNNNFNYFGIVFILYALVLYPLLGFFLGHQYPYSPTFGLPCPTSIFTFGILLLINKKIPVITIVIPLLWSIIGFGAALKLSVYEDYGLLIAGIIGFILLVILNKRNTSQIA
jgi:hypothetical protein